MYLLYLVLIVVIWCSFTHSWIIPFWYFHAYFNSITFHSWFKPRDILSLSILCAGILLVSSLHPWARTRSEFGLSDQEVKGNAFMIWAVTEINSIPVFSILHILHCWSLAVTRQVNFAVLCIVLCIFVLFLHFNFRTHKCVDFHLRTAVFGAMEHDREQDNDSIGTWRSYCFFGCVNRNGFGCVG